MFGKRADGTKELQSVRFDSAKWAPDAAKSWLREHKMRPGAFESATGEAGQRVDGEVVEFKRNVTIVHKREDQRMVFGWLYVAKDEKGVQQVDHSGEIVSTDDLEKASYGYAMDGAGGGVMHDGDSIGRLLEIVVFTPEKRAKMGIPDGYVGDAIWVGYRIDDEPTWKRVKSGELGCFSLQGKALRRALAKAAAELESMRRAA